MAVGPADSERETSKLVAVSIKYGLTRRCDRRTEQLKGESMISRRRLAAVLMSGALVVAACGSDDGGSSGDTSAGATSPAGSTAESTPAESTPAESTPADTSASTEAGGGGSEGTAAAEAVVEQYRDPNQPIGVTIPLDGVPEKKTIAWLECELESCPYITTGMKDATDALGWDLMVISSESANPAPYFQQAIDAGVDFIASSGESPALYEEQAQAAADAGIKILSCFDTTPPDGPNTNIWTQCGDTSFVEKTGPLMADWAIVDSGGTANVLIVSIPDFPVLKAETDAYIAELEKNCPDCQHSELNITIPQLTGGEVPSAVASQLQANPDIDYVFFSFGSLPSGVTAALDSAGLLDQVTVYGQDFSAFDLEEIVAGTMGAWSADPKAYAGWLMVDAAARLALGMDLEEERAAASLPTYLVEDADSAQSILDCCEGDWFPPTMQDDFKALWGVN
jgi:ribose transport system substrate-binding protein